MCVYERERDGKRRREKERGREEGRGREREHKPGCHSTWVRAEDNFWKSTPAFLLLGPPSPD